MAVNIGPRIGLEGEAEYKKSIKEIIAEQKALSAEMKATESAFDKNASAQDKATAKAENLNKQIENQKEYIAKLKDQLDKAKEAYGENSTTVSKLRENIAKAETALSKMEDELEDCNEEIGKGRWTQLSEKMDEIGGKMKDIGGTMKDFGTNMSKYVTAPLAAVAGLSVKAWKDVDEAMDDMVKMTGKTGDALKELQDSAKKIATTLPVAMEDSAKAVAEVNTRFDASGELAEELATTFLKFSDITGVDVVDAIDSVQHAMATWGLSTDKAGDLLDVLNKVSQDTGASVEELSAGIADNKTVFDDMGMSVFTAAGFLGEMDKAGVDSSTVMAGLKKALQNATKEGKPLDEALKELSDTLVSGESDTEAYQEAMELFGNKAGPQLADALRDGRISLTEFSRTAGDSMGSVDQTFDEMLDPADKFTTAMNELKILGADVGGVLLESLVPILEKVGEWIKKVAEWWSGLSPQMQNTILIIGGIVAAIGPLIGLIGSLATVVGALNIALGPVLLIILAVAAAIAGIILVIKNWGKITEWLKGVWESVTGFIKETAESIGNWVSEKWNAVKEKTAEAWDNVKQKTSEAWNNIKNKVEENGGGIKGVMKTFTDGYKEMWSNAFQWINEKTGGKLGEVLQKVKDKLASIKQKFTDTFDSIKNFISTTIDKIKNFFSNLSLKLPHIKLPHFKLTGSFSLSPPSVPHLSIDWYKKAYSSPMLFTRPTVLSTASGLKGFGDGAGGEIVIGQNMMYTMIKDAVRASGGGKNTYTIDITVNGAEGQDVTELADVLAERLTFEIQRREAALA